MDTLINLGLSYRHEEDFDNAIFAYKKALDLDQKSKLAHNNLGWAYHLQGKDNKAIDCYHRALEIDPAYGLSVTNLTNIYNDREEYYLAIKVFEAALDANPSEVDNWIDLGLAYRRTNQYDQAFRAYERALKLNPEEKLAYNNMGWAHYCIEQYEEAVECFNKSIEIDPSYEKPKINLETVYKDLIELNIMKDSLWKKVARGFYNSKKYDRAFESINYAIDINPGDEDAEKLLKKIQKALKKAQLEPIIEEKLNEALEIFKASSRSCQLKEIVEYIKYKHPELKIEKLEIKFKILEQIKDGKLNAEFDEDKLIFLKLR